VGYGRYRRVRERRGALGHAFLLPPHMPYFALAGDPERVQIRAGSRQHFAGGGKMEL